jgi:hypothetical protein
LDSPAPVIARSSASGDAIAWRLRDIDGALWRLRFSRGGMIRSSLTTHSVMPALVAGIHVLLSLHKGVDGRLLIVAS